jgi:carboxylesterase type B
MRHGFGGDPNRIVLIGHSAGATHVANYIFNKSLQPSGGPGVAGTVPDQRAAIGSPTTRRSERKGHAGLFRR